MMIKSGGNLPSLIGIDPLKRISPSRFFRMVCCQLREVLISNRIERLLPSSPNIYFGTLAHEFLEKVGIGKISRVEDLENEWLSSITELEQRLLCMKMEKHLVPLSKSVSQYEIKKRLLFKKALSLMANRRFGFNNNVKATQTIERWFETKDRIVGGAIDKIIFTSSGYKVIDFKTGVVIDKNTFEIKKEYKYQMLIYAALLYENLNEWPVALEIHDLNGSVHSIKYKKEQSIRLLNEAKELFHRVNGLISRTDSFFELQKYLANPAPQYCRYCEFRPICNAYWSKKDMSPQLNWGMDIRGQCESLTTLGNGSYLLKIRSGLNTYKVRGLNPNRHQILEGRFLSIYNLSADKTNNCFSEKMLTMIYTNK
ncbi:hypothetical protein C2I27_15255 [Priestia megaterium]|uniref:PD-(D/E)XK nuclease family protein n=1 Tax=Priestia megaterium TaxID=1404 RepID=UPI000D50FDFB|nr:PD-(D/E)XK nuclease family protein [Priestia megaterium]PVC67985.1 hypothetical protein C2I27_15255 [Priestia megaterium]